MFRQLQTALFGKKVKGNELMYFIIHSKYFPDSDWLKAHA